MIKRYWLTAFAAAAMAPAIALAGETVRYEYDALGRLTKATIDTGPKAGVVTTYSYDAAGNRTTVTVTGNTTTPPLPPNATLVDWSFEEPDVSGQPNGFQYNPPVGGAYFAGGSGIARNGSAWGFSTAPHGSQVGYLQSSASASAYIVLNISGMVPGTQYVVNFKMARRPGWNPDQMTMAAQGNTLGTFSPASTTFQSVTTPAFTANSDVGTLYMTGTVSSANLTVAIDQITITPVG